MSDPRTANAEPGDRLLFLKDVYKSYGRKLVLDNVDLAVASGEFCTVVGPSGCGKSTLLRLVLGQERADSGVLLVDKQPIGFAGTDRGIVYQRYSLFPHLSVLNNVVLGKKLHAGPWRWLRQRRACREEAMHYLERVGLAQHGDKYPHELSGGMQQRVAIAQSLILRPKVLMMDEPFGALDPGTREAMQIFVLELWEQTKMTVFFVTHDLDEAVFLGTRILIVSPFYTDDRGPDAARGARIVGDYPLERRAFSTAVKASVQHTSLIADIRHVGFDPAHRSHVTSFNLSHPDSFQTLAPGEDKTQG